MEKCSFIRISGVVILCGICTMHLLTVVKGGFCRRLDLTPPISGRALKDHVIKNLTVASPRFCEIKCYWDSDCVSYNVGPLNRSKHLCELSDSDHKTHDEDLVPREGFTYRGAENACFNDPCPFLQTCQNGFTNKKYRCLCQENKTRNNSVEEKWEKVNLCPVCFGATDGTQGSFTIQKPGLIVGFKLVHRSGKVNCSPNPLYKTNWGCTVGGFEDKQLSTLITYADKTLLLPAEDLLRMGDNCPLKYSYALVDPDAEELEFPPFSSPVPVSCDQEFLIWYGQDLADCSEDNNGGESCVDVYAWYN